MRTPLALAALLLFGGLLAPPASAQTPVDDDPAKQPVLMEPADRAQRPVLMGSDDPAQQPVLMESDDPAQQPVLMDSDPVHHTSVADPTPVDADALDASALMPDRTPAEQRVAEIIAEDGVHVVHFWAPWCPNSLAELDAGWYQLVEDHPDASFTFVTVWNNGKDGQEALDERAIPERVEVLTQLDRGDSSDKSNRRKTFLDVPMTWIPSTWVFHKNGELAFAFNYGEMEMDQIAKAIEQVRADWSH